MSNLHVPTITPVESVELCARGPGIFSQHGQRLTTPSGRWVPVAVQRPLTNPILLEQRGIVCPTPPKRDGSLPPLPTCAVEKGRDIGRRVILPFNGKAAPGTIKPRVLPTLQSTLYTYEAIAKNMVKNNVLFVDEATTELVGAMETIHMAANSMQYDLFWQQRMLALDQPLGQTSAPYGIVPCPTGRSPLRQAAAVILALISFRRIVQADALRPDVCVGRALATTQYCNVFNCTRSWSGKQDVINAYVENHSVTVVYEGRYYNVPYENSVGYSLDMAQMEETLKSIVDGNIGGEVRPRDLPYLGAVTELPREECQSILSSIDNNDTNRASLDSIVQSSFVVVLMAGEKNGGDSVPALVSSVQPGSMWLEKSLNVAVLNDGTAVVRGDSALFDDIAIHRLCSYCSTWSPEKDGTTTGTGGGQVNILSLLENAVYSPGINRAVPAPPPTAGTKGMPPPPQQSTDKKVPPLPPPESVGEPTRASLWYGKTELQIIQNAISMVCSTPTTTGETSDNTTVASPTSSRWEWVSSSIASVRPAQILALQLDVTAFFHLGVQLALYRASMNRYIPIVHEVVTNQVYMYGRPTSSCLMTTPESLAMLRAMCERKKATRPLSLREVEAIIVKAVAAEAKVIQDGNAGQSFLHTMMLLEHVYPKASVFGSDMPYAKMVNPHVVTRCGDGFSGAASVSRSPTPGSITIDYRTKGSEYTLTLWSTVNGGSATATLPGVNQMMEELSHALKDLYQVVTSHRRHK